MPTSDAARTTAAASSTRVSTLRELWQCIVAPTPPRAKREKATSASR